jgi:hypothetical protein
MPPLLRSIVPQQYHKCLDLPGHGLSTSPFQLATSMGLIFRALRDADFTKRIVHADFEDVSEALTLDGQHSSYNARTVWSRIDLSCLLVVYIYENSHPRETGKDKSWLWRIECVRALSNTGLLKVYGCGYTDCELSGCSAIFRGLNRTAFTHLYVFHLSNI